MNVKMTEIIQKLSFQVENVNFPCCFPSWWVGGSGKSHNKGRRENYQPLIAQTAATEIEIKTSYKRNTEKAKL